MCWIRRCDLPNDQKIVQHPDRSEFLLNGRFGPRKVLNPGSHMERAHSLEFQAVRAATFKKLPARPGVSSPSVPIGSFESRTFRSRSKVRNQKRHNARLESRRRQDAVGFNSQGSVSGLRDLALIAAMFYSFAPVSAVLKLLLREDNV
jgi:hypothetical protein